LLTLPELASTEYVFNTREELSKLAEDIPQNVDCRSLLVFGSENELRESVKETIEKAAPGGGYIISSSNSIYPGCKPENYIAMVHAAREYGV